MLRKTTFLLLVISFIAFGAGADGKKVKAKSGSTLSTINTDTRTISASEGSTAQAIRGIMEPRDGGAAVIGFAAGVVTARDRLSGRTFKFNVPPTSNVRIGDNVVVSSGFAQVAGLTGRFNVYGLGGCCSVAAVNASNRTFSVREPAVGRTFVVNLQPTNAMRIGQPVEADFKAGTAWIAGNTALKGQITNLSAPAGLHP
jgi:hypothetical protein